MEVISAILYVTEEAPHTSLSPYLISASYTPFYPLPFSS